MFPDKNLPFFSAVLKETTKHLIGSQDKGYCTIDETTMTQRTIGSLFANETEEQKG